MKGHIDMSALKVSLIEKEQVAQQLGVSINTLYAWIHQKRIPYVKIGSLVKFDQYDIDVWIEEKKVKVRDFH